jgi:hypothetical protein
MMISAEKGSGSATCDNMGRRVVLNGGMEADTVAALTLTM